MKKVISKIIFIIILFIMFFFIGYSTTYALYVVNTTGTVTSKVAKFSLSIDKNEVSFPYQLSTDNYESSVNYYKFKVTNIENSKVSEVKLNYVLKMQTTRNIPFDISLYKVSSTVFNNTTTTSSNLGSETLILTMTYPTNSVATTSGSFTANVLKEDYYVIKINWNSSEQYRKYIYQNKIDLLKLNATFEQVI